MLCKMIFTKKSAKSKFKYTLSLTLLLFMLFEKSLFPSKTKVLPGYLSRVQSNYQYHVLYTISIIRIKIDSLLQEQFMNFIND
jgi:hypothetical protein